MKHVIILVSGILLMGPALYGQETQKANLAQNPGFENASAKNPNMPDWWGSEDWGPGTNRNYTWDDKVAHTGKRSVCVECPAGANGAWVKYIYRKDKADFNFKPDKFYQMSAWVKTEAGTTANIILDGLEVMGGERPLTATTGPHDWKQLFIKGAQLKADAEWVGICVVCRNGGKVWFDDVEIVEMPE